MKIKLFKNFKTKRQLREENAKLRGMLYPQRPQLQTVEREVQKVSSDMEFDINISTEVIKHRITQGMIEYLQPLIEWDIEDDRSNPFKKRMRGNIYLAKKK